jgi:hypothetical protein
METTMKVNDVNTATEAYISSLSAKEKQAFHIAQEHLGSLFTVEKNNGYLDWCKKRKVEAELSASSNQSSHQ